MADDILGISAHFDVSEIVTGFNTLIDLLEKAGTVSDEMADEVTRALTAIQYNLSNGLTAEGMEELVNQLDKVKSKVVEASNAFANGTSNLDFSQFNDMVANYQQITSAVFSATTAAYQSEAENVQRLEAELQELINRREEMAAMGSDEDFEKVSKAVFDVSQKVAEGRERMAEYAEAMKDGGISETERSALLADYNAIVADGLELRDMLAEATGYGNGSSSEGSGAFKAASSFNQEQGDELNGRLTAIQIGQQQGILQRSAIIEAVGGISLCVGDIQANTRRLAGDVSAMRDMQYESVRRLTEIRDNTDVLPRMAQAIDSMDATLKMKL